MKAITQKAFMVLVEVCLVMVVAAFGQSGGDYELNWSTIDGGGGRSSGGPYELMGTIGQPDAAAMSGGDYELLGGFWPGGPICVVDFNRFARFAEWWLVTGDDLPADLYEDEHDIVDGFDLKVFVEEWLCNCLVDWSLR